MEPYPVIDSAKSKYKGTFVCSFYYFPIMALTIWILKWHNSYIQSQFPGGRDKDGKMFGKGVVEYDNGDIIAGMFKVCK